MNDKNRSGTQEVRRTDLKISIVLIVLCVLLIWETTSFPMTGSFGGVESHWFVSPALFPMMLLITLLSASVMLCIRAYKETTEKKLLRLDGWIGDMAQPINRERWYVIITLCVYIYLYIPSIDFYLATVMFLMTLCCRYYLNDAILKYCMIFLNAMVIIYLLIVRYLFSGKFYFISMEASVDEFSILYSDIGVIVAIVSGLIIMLRSSESRRRKKHIAITALVVPLVLLMSFNFILQVPMPVEYGSIIKSMEFVWYELLNQ